MDVPTADLVCLLLGALPDEEPPPVPYERSTPGLCNVIEAGPETMARRIELLNAIQELEDDGLVERRVRFVEGVETERNVYYLTGPGRAHADRRRSELAAERIEVRDGGAHTVALANVDEHLDEPFPLVTALARVTDDGVLYLDEVDGEAFVDRTAALETVESALAAAGDGTAQVVGVTGPAGVGKTALLEEAGARAENAGFESLYGVVPAASASPYAGLRDALSGTDVAVEFPTSGAPVTGGDARPAPDRRASAYRQFAADLGQWADGRPICLAVDDLHRADPATRELLATVARELSDRPLCLLVAWEDGATDGPTPLSGELDERIALDPFDRAGTRAAITHLLEARDVPGDFVDAIQAQTGGLPLLVAESVTALVEAGTVDPARRIYPEDVTVPDAVQSTVADRLDRLDGPARRILDLGAVIGDPIPASVLTAVTDEPAAAVQDYVDLLVDAGLWDRGEGSYRFSGSALRAVALDALPDDRRVSLHRDVATALAEATDGDGRLAATARHFERAGDPDRALSYYRDAAEDAADRYAYETAREHSERALELAQDRDEDATLGIAIDIARTAGIVGEYEEAVKYAEYVRDRADDVDIERRAHAILALTKGRQGDAAAVLEHAEAGLALGDGEPPATAVTCRLLSEKGWAYLQMGRYEDAAATFEREVALARNVDGETLGTALHDHGTALAHLGDRSAAVEILERVVADRDGADDSGLASTLDTLGILHMRLGDDDLARERFDQCERIYRRLDDRSGLASVLTNRGVLEDGLGNWDDAIDHYEQALSINRDLGKQWGVSILESNIGYVLLRRGELDSAVDHLERSDELATEIDDGQGRALAKSLLSVAALWRDDGETASDLADAAVTAAEETDSVEELAHATTRRGTVARVRGDLDAAVDNHETAVELAEESGSDEKLAWALFALADDHLARYDTAATAAGDSLAAASEVADRAETVVERADDPHLQTCARQRSVAVRGREDGFGAVREAFESVADAHRGRESTPYVCRTTLARARTAAVTGASEAARDAAAETAELAAAADLPLFERLADDVHTED